MLLRRCADGARTAGAGRGAWRLGEMPNLSHLRRGAAVGCREKSDRSPIDAQGRL